MADHRKRPYESTAEVRDAVLNVLDRVSSTATGHVACCPAHDDGNPSLAIDLGDDGRVLLHCRALCSPGEVISALSSRLPQGLSASDLFPPGSRKPARKRGGKGRGFDSPEALANWLAGSAGGGIANVAARRFHVYADAEGAEQFRVLRLDLHEPVKDRGKPTRKIIRPAHVNAAGRWQCKKPPGDAYASLPYNLASALAEPDDSILAVEGEQAVDALAAVGIAATCNAGGAGKWTSAHAEHFAGADVVILPDADAAGEKHAAGVARTLLAVDAKMRRLDLPGPDGGPPPKGWDVADWIEAGGTAEELREMVAAASAWEPPPEESRGGGNNPRVAGASGGRPEIEVSTDEHLTNDAAAEALGGLPDLYERGGVLVRVTPAGDDGIPPIRVLKPASTRDSLSRAAVFFKWALGDDGEPVQKDVHPPGSCVAAVHDRGFWPAVRSLAGIAAGPVLRADGSVLATAGYDSATGLIVPPAALSGVPPIADSPAAADVQAAVEALFYVVADFPFAAPAHRAAWLASLLTVLARPAFEGPAPLFLLDANRSGAGKGLLAGVTMLIAAGRRPAVDVLSGRHEEDVKIITAWAAEARSIIFLDNLPTGGRLAGAAMEAALTADTWSGRLLGASATYTGPLRAVWFASGNNIAPAGDMPRRIVPMRIESPDEHPEDRPAASFREPDLAGYVESNRGRLLAAGLTILRGYVAAGRPEPDGGRRAFGDYGGWSRLVRDATVWATGLDPLDSREHVAAVADDDAAELAGLLDALHAADPDGTGMEARKILSVAESMDAVGLRYAVADLCDLPDGRLPGARSLGKKLASVVGRVIGGRRLVRLPGRSRRTLWTVAGPEPADRPAVRF